MQIFYPPESLAFFLCFIIWPVLQTIAAVICKILPVNFFSPYSFFFKSHKWEQNGQIYKDIQNTPMEKIPARQRHDNKRQL